jgi:biotin transport system substrate-specific component
MNIQNMTRVGIFAAITVVLSQIAIPLPFTPVPLSLSLLAVFMTGVILSPKGAFLAQMVYLLLGAVGLPVFHGFTGGFSRLIGPTGGYLVAYPLMAAAVSLSISLYEKKRGEENPPFSPALAGWVLGGHAAALLICYVLGTIWLCTLSGVSLGQALGMAVYPFIPLDAAKALVCTFAILPMRRRIGAASFASNK